VVDCSSLAQWETRHFYWSATQKTRSSCCQLGIVGRRFVSGLVDGILFLPAPPKQELVHSASLKKANITASNQSLFWHSGSAVISIVFLVPTHYPASAIAPASCPLQLQRPMNLLGLPDKSIKWPGAIAGFYSLFAVGQLSPKNDSAFWINKKKMIIRFPTLDSNSASKTLNCNKLGVRRVYACSNHPPFCWWGAWLNLLKLLGSTTVFFADHGCLIPASWSTNHVTGLYLQGAIPCRHK